MDNKQFKIVNAKLDKMLRLLVLSVVKDLKGDEQVRILSSAGFRPVETAVFLGKRPDAVRQALRRIRKKQISQGEFQERDTRWKK